MIPVISCHILSYPRHYSIIMCNPFPPISKYLKSLAKLPVPVWPTPVPNIAAAFGSTVKGRNVAGHAGRNGMAPAVCHLQKNESYDIGHRDALGYHLDITWISLGYHLDITWISLGYVVVLRLEKGTKEHYRHYLAERERERAVCVCVLSPLIVMRVRVCKLKSVDNFTCLPGVCVCVCSCANSAQLHSRLSRA